MSKKTYVYQGEDNKTIKLKEFENVSDGGILNLGVPTVTPIQPNERRISSITIDKTLLENFSTTYESEIGMSEESGYFTRINEYKWNCDIDFAPNQKVYIIATPIFTENATTQDKTDFLSNFVNGEWTNFFRFYGDTSTDTGVFRDESLWYNGDINNIKFCVKPTTFNGLVTLTDIKLLKMIFYDYGTILENVFIDVLGVVDELEIPNTTKTSTTEVIPFKPLLDTSVTNAISAKRNANRLFEKYFNLKDNSTNLKLKWIQDVFDYPSLQIPTMYDIQLGVIVNDNN